MKSRPAYVLLVVMIVAAAAASAAALLVVASGQGTITAMHTEGGELAKGVAESGLEHTLAVLARSGFSDFDEELDPGLLADCTNMATSAAVPTCAKCGLPLLKKPDATDATIVTYEGKTYRMLPFNGGAYMARYDDDDDDQITDAASAGGYTGFTNNNTGIGAKCVEGPTSIASNGQNYVRDRNRTVWVTVVGIYPGTNPATAKHRVALRKLHAAKAPSTVAGIQVRGNIETSGGGKIAACSPIGSIEADGNFTQSGSGFGCACGDSKAQDITGDWDHCTDTPTVCSAQVPPIECADGELSEATITVPALGANDVAGPTGSDFYVNWARPCVFFIDTNRTLWSWDATATRGPASSPNCSSLEGLKFSAPYPPNLSKIGSGSAATGTDWSGCWTPLILELANGSCTRVAANDATDTKKEHDKTGNNCSWRPIGDQSWTLTGAQINARFAAAGAPAGAIFNKPAWGVCKVLYPPFPEPSVPQQDLGCMTPASGTARCVDGADAGELGDNTALFGKTTGGGEVWFGATADASGNSDIAARANLEAVPAGVYIFGDSITRSGVNFDFLAGALAAPKQPMLHFPLATLMTTGAIDLTNEFWIGFGQASGNPDGSGVRFPSTITNGNFSMSGGAEYRLAGSIYTTGNVNWNGNGLGTFHGELFSNGNLNIGGTGDFVWRYETALQRPPIPTSGPPLTYPVPQ
ncbi:MAG: hypothetical protein Q8O67_03930 [Deltaproteobacteria bacterium]|nr:hypothetical protein [Deltaproteobacteria bacterium]